jgi:coenzyme F420-reducing hydrogenase delta subunit
MSKKFVGFVCEWGGYTAADLAGFRRVAHPADLRTVRVECTGRVDPVWMLDALIEGAEGAMIIGCPMGDSRHEVGNYRAQERTRWVAKGLALVGERPDRVRTAFLASEDAEGYARTVEEFSRLLDAFGPLDRSEKGLERLRALREVFASEKIRWLVGQGQSMAEQGDAFLEKVPRAELDARIEGILRDEYRRVRVLRGLRGGPLSVAALAARLGLPAETVMRDVSDLVGIGRLAIEGHGDAPCFREVTR